ncbi:tyrosine-type recombinase/integrase [Heliophilum fasciatum]|uniref:Integrase/recombinase XerC/integrase/recombinase XerD n=1 Tax=Heliophilum fasciatum TaxID=35700 RepID=A0A4R2RQ05_9FIRM|nr:tyrosine-type recombinase/integrase [Heliophilum fasciatum]MCW2279097.1 integrase/recombinase XerC/integrase/recombinase XerD [Heliophilum fasciatum]TCP61275.1 integrase/recombinase XerC/integrase/recombinase XerD [Heliophilum fasciatum]
MIVAFIEELQRQGKSLITVRSYQDSWARFSRWFENEHPRPTPTGGVPTPQQATQLDIANFKRFASSNFKPNTVALTMTHMNAIFRWLTENAVIPDNPVDLVDRITVPQSAPKWLNRNEQNLLVRIVRQHGGLRDLTMVTLMLHTGVRVQELCDIRLADVKISDRKGILVIPNGKHGKYREIPLNVDCRRILQRYLQTRHSNSEYLFTSQRSDQLSPRAVSFLIAKYSKISGIDHLTCHTLRHSFGHELAVRKVPMDVIARLMGHMKNNGLPNIAMTSRYTMPGEEDLARAVEELSWV